MEPKPQLDVINAAVDALRNVPGVHALFLAGSHGAGLQDKCSDIDFLAVVTEPAAAGFSDLWRETLGGNILLWRERPGQVINAIVGDWVRIDVRFIAPAQLAGLSRDRLKPLFDHDEIYGTLPAVAPPPALDKEKMSWQVEEFIRILGLLPVAMGRGEYINGVTGLGFLRGLLIDLLIAETGAPHRGGALHLNRLITAEHKAILTALPPLVPERRALIGAHLAYAAAYLPRARALTRRAGIRWPDRLEAALWARLKSTLDIDPPASSPGA